MQLSADLKARLADLVKAARILELHGHSDRIWGHVAMRDPEGRGFWIKRHGISLGEVFDASDFQLTGFDGEELAGEGRRHSEWPIHGEVLLARPDLNFTAHTHPFYGSIYSAVSGPLRYVRAASPLPPPRYEGSSELITSRERGAEIAEALSDGTEMFMRNHGVVFAGETALDMVRTGIEMEEKCQQMLVVSGSGLDWAWPGDDEEKRKRTDVKGRGRDDALWDHYQRILARAEQAGDIRLARGPVPKD